MKTGKSIIGILMIVVVVLGFTITSATAELFFTEDFESPVGDNAYIYAGVTNFDNTVTAAGTQNGSPFVGRMQQTESTTGPKSGNQWYEMNGGFATDSSILFSEVVPANALVDGSLLTVTIWSASVFSDTVDDTFDVIVSGGVNDTASFVADSARGVWQQHTCTFFVTDATQAIDLQILATRESTYSEDLAIDLIEVFGGPPPITSGTAITVFTEDFESPVGDAAYIYAGVTNFDNTVTAAGTQIGAPFVGRMQQTESTTGPKSGNQWYEMNGGQLLDSSILFSEAVPANTFVDSSLLTVTIWSASVWSDTVDDTFNVIVSGGAFGTANFIANSARGVWQQHTCNFYVHDATQAIDLKILATRTATTGEDLAIDLIEVAGFRPLRGTVILVL